MTRIDVGTELAGLRLEELAGHGGSGSVYRAVDEATGRRLAVKVVETPDDSSQRRVAREAELLAAVDHPGVVPFVDFHRFDGRAAIVTEWIDGPSLRAVLREAGPLEPQAALDLLDHLADALGHLHRAGIVHRDITPANVIITDRPDGRPSPVLIDLGIGHRLDSTTMTANDLLAGTPDSLAPELIRGEPASPASDQYSLAVLLHRAVAGRSPFPDGEQVATALHHQLHTSPVALNEVKPDVSAAMTDAVLRALDKDPLGRFPSVGAMAEAASGRIRTPSAESVGRNRDEARSRSRRPYLAMLAVTAVVATTVVGLTLLAPTALDRGTDDQPDPLTVAGDPGAQPTSTAGASVASITGTSTITTAAAATTTAVDPTTVDSGTTATSGTAEPSEPSVAAVDPAWPPGRARDLRCNLLTGIDFETGSLPIDFYGEPPGRERVVVDRGYGGTSGLEVGSPGLFGQYAEAVPIEPDTGYLFRGWFSREGEVADARMAIIFLNTTFDFVGSAVERVIIGDQAGFHQVEVQRAPDGAAYVTPQLFKDGSDGVLVADELVFGPSDDCRAELNGGAG